MGRSKVVVNLICKNCVHLDTLENPSNSWGYCACRKTLVNLGQAFCSSFECGDWSNIKRKERILFDDGSQYRTTRV